MTDDSPRRERGVAYWLSLIEEPCPCCGMTGPEGSNRCGNLCKDHRTNDDFILCVECSTTIERACPSQLEMLDARITHALGHR